MALTLFEGTKPQCTILCLWEIDKSKWQEQESTVLSSTSTNKQEWNGTVHAHFSLPHC